MVLHVVVRVLHLVSMALWLGAALWAPGDAKRSLAAGRAQLVGLSRRVVTALRVSVWAGVATLLTGVAMVLLAPAHSIGVSVGFAVTILLLILEMTIVLPAGRRIGAIAEAGGDLSEASSMARKLSALSGVAHLLWLVALVSMVLAGRGY